MVNNNEDRRNKQLTNMNETQEKQYRTKIRSEISIPALQEILDTILLRME